MLNSESKELVLSTLASDAFVAVNKKLLRALDGEATDVLLLSELIALYRYAQRREYAEELFEAIEVSVNQIEKTLRISDYRQRASLNRLQDRNLLVYYRKGMPARRYVSIDFDAVQRLLNTEELRAKAEADKKNAFYAQLNRRLSEYLNKREYTKLATSDVFGNIKQPLQDTLCMLSAYLNDRAFFEEGYERVAQWTSQAIGVLKHIISQQKTEAQGLELSRLYDAILLAGREATTETQLVFEIAKSWKKVIPREPAERFYSFAAFISSVTKKEEK